MRGIFNGLLLIPVRLKKADRKKVFIGSIRSSFIGRIKPLKIIKFNYPKLAE